MSTLASVIERDVIANRPAAGIPGRLFFASDESKTYRDNGTSWDDVSDTGSLPSQPFILCAYYPGKPSASAYIPFEIPSDISPAYPANLANSTGKCGANPTSALSLPVTDNGTQIGTISVSTAGAVTFSTTGGASGTVSAAHEVQVQFPATPDATFADFRFSLAFTR